MTKFVELFEKYGYSVEPCGHNSYIAYNNIYCVTFTEIQSPFTAICAVSLYAKDKDAIKEWYLKNDSFGIGANVYDDVMNNRCKFDVYRYGLCNHDHSLTEVESFLQKN